MTHHHQCCNFGKDRPLHLRHKALGNFESHGHRSLIYRSFTRAHHNPIPIPVSPWNLSYPISENGLSLYDWFNLSNFFYSGSSSVLWIYVVQVLFGNLGEHVLSEPNNGHQTTWAVKQPSYAKLILIIFVLQISCTNSQPLLRRALRGWYFLRFQTKHSY